MYAFMKEHDKRMARAFVNALVKRNARVSVNDGESWVCNKATKRDVILASIGEAEYETVRVCDEFGNILGSFILVWGNGPGELVADYTANAFCESIMRRCGSAVTE